MDLAAGCCCFASGICIYKIWNGIKLLHSSCFKIFVYQFEIECLTTLASGFFVFRFDRIIVKISTSHILKRLFDKVPEKIHTKSKGTRTRAVVAWKGWEKNIKNAFSRVLLTNNRRAKAKLMFLSRINGSQDFYKHHRLFYTFIHL